MPFKSEKQRRWAHVNEPEMADKWEREYATGGMIKKAIANKMKLADYSHLRAGGMIKNGSLTPKYKSGGIVENFQDQVCRKALKGS